MAKRENTKPTAIDLFCGCGGLTLGLKLAGFSVRAGVEIDGLAADTFRRNHAEVRVYAEDIRKLDADKMRRDLRLSKGQLDLLSGCPPCQGFSSINTRNGAYTITSRDNELVFDIVRFAVAFSPKAIMMENVPGLARDTRLTRLMEMLAELGYGAHFRVLDASSYGVPQRRRRLILLAGKGSTPRFAPKARHVRTVRETISRLPVPGTSGDPLHDFPEQRSPRIRRLIMAIPIDGGSRRDLPASQQLQCHKLTDGFKDVYGRMMWDAVAPTLTSGCVNPSRGRFLHPEADRAITLREAALLQTFPQTYEFSLTEGKYATARMIGNALPPEFIRRHASRILAWLTKNDFS